MYKKYNTSVHLLCAPVGVNSPEISDKRVHVGELESMAMQDAIVHESCISASHECVCHMNVIT